MSSLKVDTFRSTSGSMRYETYILCKYGENEKGEITLTRVAKENFSTGDKAKECADTLDPKQRYIVLTELTITDFDSRGS